MSEGKNCRKLYSSVYRDLKEFIKNEQNTTTQVDKDDTQGDCHHENKED